MNESPAPRERNPPARHPYRSQTLIILGIAFALRLLVLWTVFTRYSAHWFFTRGIEMGLLANSLLAGRGLSSPFGESTGPTAFVAPGYPLLVAAVFRTFGSGTRASAIFLILAQILINLLTLWLILFLARTLAGPRQARSAAWIAGIFWAISPAVLWIPTIFWDTSLASCILTALVALALRFRTARGLSPRTALGLGAGLGLAALLNPALLLVLGAIVAWIILSRPPGPVSRHNLRSSALAALAFAVVFSPWPIRNAQVFHSFIPLRTTVGFELWMGNRDGATGFLEESLFPLYNRDELADYKTRGELPYSARKSDLAKSWILQHPTAFLRLTALRIARFWSGTGSKGGSLLFALHACLTSLFGLAGLSLLFRRRAFRAAIPFALPLLLFPLAYYITHAEFRYRLVLDPILTALAAFALITRRVSPQMLSSPPGASKIEIASKDAGKIGEKSWRNHSGQTRIMEEQGKSSN